MNASTVSTRYPRERISATKAAMRILNSRTGAQSVVAVFDVRDETSYRIGHVFGSDHLSDHDFASLVRTLPRSTPVLIYCYHGNASRIWAQRFRDAHFTEVQSVDGGYPALAAALKEQATEPARGWSAAPGFQMAAFA